MSDQSVPPVTPQAVQSPAPVVSDDRSGGSVAPALVQTIAQSPQVVPEPQPQISSRNKEKGSTAISESAPIVEVGAGIGGVEEEKIPEAVEAWMEKVGEEEAQVKLDTLPSIQVPPPAPQMGSSSQPVFVLPLGQEEMQLGLHASVNDSIRWLATWAQRVIKQLKGKTAFAKS